MTSTFLVYFFFYVLTHSLLLFVFHSLLLFYYVQTQHTPGTSACTARRRTRPRRSP